MQHNSLRGDFMQDLYLGLTTVLGFIIYALGGYFVFFKPSREKFWGCFIIGSMMMGTGLVCSLYAKNVSLIVGIYLFSAIAWLIMSTIFSSCTSFISSYNTKEEVLTFLSGNPLKISTEDVFEGVYVSWDQYYSEAGEFKYKITKVEKVDTYLNSFRKEQHYTYKNLERGFNSIEDCKDYFNNINNTPFKL